MVVPLVVNELFGDDHVMMRQVDVFEVAEFSLVTGAKRTNDVLHVVKEDVISRVNYLFIISRDEIMHSFVCCMFTRTRQGENSDERGDGLNAGRISRRCL